MLIAELNKSPKELGDRKFSSYLLQSLEKLNINDYIYVCRNCSITNRIAIVGAVIRTILKRNKINYYYSVENSTKDFGSIKIIKVTKIK